MTGVRPLDEYEPEDGVGSPYGSYYVVLPEGPWETRQSTKDSPIPAPRSGGLVGVVTALVAGAIPALLVADLAAEMRQRVVDMLNTRRDEEWLIKGKVPRKYVRGPYPNPVPKPGGA